MFRDRHEYYAIAVSSDSLNSVKKAMDLLRPEAVAEPERIATIGHEGFDATHFFYYSPDRFSRSQELEDARFPWNGIEQFRYNMYVFGLPVSKSFVIILAVPFFAMGRAVFSEFVKSAPGLGLTFYSVALDLLMAAIKEGRHEGGIIRISDVELAVLGDTSIDQVALSGTDVLNSVTFAKIAESAAAAATTLTPSRCRITIDDHSRPRFVLATDRYGNFSFRLGRNATNIFPGMTLFSYLKREGLMQTTFAFPPARKDPREEAQEV